MPKKILFNWLARPRPCCGPMKRWRDAQEEMEGCSEEDLQVMGISTRL